jgi:hypothetical protein
MTSDREPEAPRRMKAELTLDLEHPAHRGLIAYFRGAEGAEGAEGAAGAETDSAESPEAAAPAIAPYETGPRPYLGMGSHPDVVTRVWDVLGAALPEDGRAVVFGAPALVHAQRGIVLAMAFGTSYLLHLPEAIAAEASERGYKTRETWSDGAVTELAGTFGAGWFWGRWLDEEEAWMREAFARWAES